MCTLAVVSFLLDGNTNIKQTAYLFHVYRKGAGGLTLWAGSRANLLVLVLIERTENKATLWTVVFDHAQLWQDSSGTGNYTAGTDQLIQVELPVK